VYQNPKQKEKSRKATNPKKKEKNFFLSFFGSWVSCLWFWGEFEARRGKTLGLLLL
jgi:hypothetical protein